MVSEPEHPIGKRPHIRMRGIYGSMPRDLIERGGGLEDSGINAVFMHSGIVDAEKVSVLHRHGARVFAEFNSMHDDVYVKGHADATPVGINGEVCPAPGGWQGACPTHPGYREQRMGAFRSLLERLGLDGIWLDYHHSHANWEQAAPEMPDTCFCRRCLARFADETHVELPDKHIGELTRLLLGEHRETWVRWRCGVFTDWVRQYRAILDEVRPEALLGTFHNPWSDGDLNGARLHKLAIDLRAQAQYLDVLSIMPYHARFGHHADPGWISRQIAWLDGYLGSEGGPRERPDIWPIVQLSDWGEPVSAFEVKKVLDHATRPPATGVTVFSWDGIRRQPRKVAELVRFYREITP